MVPEMCKTVMLAIVIIIIIVVVVVISIINQVLPAYLPYSTPL